MSCYCAIVVVVYPHGSAAAALEDLKGKLMMPGRRTPAGRASPMFLARVVISRNTAVHTNSASHVLL